MIIRFITQLVRFSAMHPCSNTTYLSRNIDSFTAHKMTARIGNRRKNMRLSVYQLAVLAIIRKDAIELASQIWMKFFSHYLHVLICTNQQRAAFSSNSPVASSKQPLTWSDNSWHTRGRLRCHHCRRLDVHVISGSESHILLDENAVKEIN